MPRIALVLSVIAVLFGATNLILLWQMRSDLRTNQATSGYASGGPGMMGCPMCGGPWRNPNGWTGAIPQSLPQPTDQEWITRLRGILVSEKFSFAQYTADEDKYRVRMPYMMIIPQEQNHVTWINGLFSAYKLSADGTVPPVKKSASITEAYQIAQALEADLIPRYEWLIGHTNDPTTRQVLDTILLQSRMHYTMFTHALQMRGMGMPY